MSETYQVIRKWYRELFLNGAYDAQFEELISDPSLDVPEKFGDHAGKNLLSALYRCEELEQRYAEMGINREVLLDTLSDLVIWTDIWYGLSGELGLMEIGWLELHLSMRLFRLGRLQFCAGKTEKDVPELGVKKGDPIVEVHIPSGKPLKIEECREAFTKAKAFFAKYFPQHEYSFFTCHSWLLDCTLEKFLAPGANILEFQRLYQVVQDDESDAAIRYIFQWNAVREKMAEYEAKSGLARKVKEYVLNGGKLYESYGFIPKENV